jgi:anaerobic ribonucleoside-triphosphate reductase
VGYLRPVQNWNQGKRQEFKDRAVYKLNAKQQILEDH